jgi:hypothetical protein
MIIVGLCSQDITVGQGGDYPTLSAAGPHIKAGDSVMVLNGVYSNGSQFLYDLTGSPDQPITIYAEDKHEVFFLGGTEAIHLVNAVHVILDGFVIQGQTGNGINIDDGGDYSTPTKFVEVRNCIFRDIVQSGNHDFLKLSGLDSFHIHHNTFMNGGTGGSGIDMVGCHDGIIEDNHIEAAGSSGIQAKGGTRGILIQRNFLKDMDQRALNLGGSTGLQFFRPPLPNPIQDAFEAADLKVYSNVFVGSWSPINYVGCVNVEVTNNTIYHPENWVIRILQETTEPGFLACSNNRFYNNIIVLPNDLREVNIGPNTAPETFHFSNNLWYNEEDGNWAPQLPVTDTFQIINDPTMKDPTMEDFDLDPGSPAIGSGKVVDEPEQDYLGRNFLTERSIGAFEGGRSTTSTGKVSEALPKLWPNPTTGLVNIDGLLEHLEYDILTSAGQIVMSGDLEKPHQLDLTHLKNGLYWIKLYKGEASEVSLPVLKLAD